MKPAILSLALIVAAATPISEAEPLPPANHFIVVDLHGPPYERGLEHGHKLKAEIVQGIAIWKQNLTSTFGVDADDFIKTFLLKTDYLPFIKQWTPDLLEEVKGIAKGSGVDFDTILAFQLMDEYWVNGPALEHEHCSAMGLQGKGGEPTVIAQNMDLESFRNGFQTILHIHEASGKEKLVLSQPGLIAFNGVNNAGIAVNTNTLAQLAHGRTGLPVAFIVRGILERESLADAAAFVKGITHASGQNYTIGDPTHVAYFEASAHSVVEVFGSPGTFILHTNHPVVNIDYGVPVSKEMVTPGTLDNSHIRYQTLQNRLSAGPGDDPLKLIQETLRSRDSATDPVSRPLLPGASFFTYSSTIMVLSGKPHLIASPGPPDVIPYSTFQFDRVLH
jgi:isopenicillin-N N-acyltransferase like protein